MRTRSTAGLAAVALAAAALACASAPTNAPTKTAGRHGAKHEAAPTWVHGDCQHFWRNAGRSTAGAAGTERLCAVGTGPDHPDRTAALETALARARAALGRQVEVTIEDLVRLEDAREDRRDLRSLSHQLSSTTLEALRVDAVWHDPEGRPHALVSIPAPRIP